MRRQNGIVILKVIKWKVSILLGLLVEYVGERVCCEQIFVMLFYRQLEFRIPGTGLEEHTMMIKYYTPSHRISYF